MRRTRRNKDGNQIAELGPAIFIILIVFLFPMLVVLYMGIAFAGGWYLNHMSAKAAAIIDPTKSMQQAVDGQTAAWMGSAFAVWTRASVLSNQVRTEDRFPNPPQQLLNDTNQNRHLPGHDVVLVTTVIQFEPFIQVPFLPLRPFPITYNTERPIEEHTIR